MRQDFINIKNKVKSKMLGSSWDLGLLYKIILYAMLILFGFIFIFPLLHMMSYGFMSPEDVTNPFVTYVPTSIYFKNFSTAFKVLNFWPSLGRSLLLAILSSVVQCLSTSLIGYGLARFKFRGKNLILVLVLLTFIIPSQVTMIPQMIMYTNLGMNNIMAFIVPALFGQGLKSPIFILIFFQFFRTVPQSLEEAAKIDGANVITIFIKLAVPLALSAFVLTFLFSFVWYFNETTLTSIFLGNTYQTLPLKLQSFQAAFSEMNSGAGSSDTGKNINEAIYMAGTFLSIIPLLLIYFIFQRHFVESIDKAGITGE